MLTPGRRKVSHGGRAEKNGRRETTTTKGTGKKSERGTEKNSRKK